MPRATPSLTHTRLREVLDFDASTGRFTWKRTLSRRRVAGSEAGGVNPKDGYARVSAWGRTYPAHRLAWFYVFGEWPVGEVDHIDGCRTNNRIDNLRCVSRRVNAQNLRRARKDSKTGLLGASLDKSTGKYVARISTEGGYRRLGLFDTAQLAHEAYLQAKRSLHAGCTI